MKQMSKYEISSFVNFAPRYFEYITKAVKENVSICFYSIQLEWSVHNYPKPLFYPVKRTTT